MIVKTEFESVEENDGSIRQAIEQRAYKLYELDGFKDGSDQYHWFRAEKELTIQDPICSIEDGKLTVRLPMEGFSAASVLVSISVSSALILKLEDKPRPLATAICCAWFRYLSRSTRLALPANSMGATLY